MMTKNRVYNGYKNIYIIDIMEYHLLEHEWTLWAHLPHNTDWTLKSYISVANFTTIEETIAVIEMLPLNVIENCMLFIMKKGIWPTWEDPQNRNGGCFSYKIPNKIVSVVWKELSYVLVGGSISMNVEFVKSVVGITISPKKNFCIVKIWMTNCKHQDPSVITREINDLSTYGCIFKKHSPEY